MLWLRYLHDTKGKNNQITAVKEQPSTLLNIKSRISFDLTISRGMMIYFWGLLVNKMAFDIRSMGLNMNIT